MKKSDLKQNMIVELRDGDRYLILENVPMGAYGEASLFFMNVDGYQSGNQFNDDLCSIGYLNFNDLSVSDCVELDIVKVMRWKHFRDLKLLNMDEADMFEVLWERPVTIYWQPWELEVLKNIPPYFNEITRIGNGDIRIRNDLSGNAHPLRLNIPSLPANKTTNNVWLNIDDELARNGMKR